jgi:hypothetical protein
MADELNLTLRFRLMDYLAVQGWCLRQRLGLRVCIFLVCITAPMIGIPLMDGEPLAEIFDTVLRAWRGYPFLILGVFAFFCVLPFIAVTVSWLFRKVARENRVTLSRENITFSSADWSLGAPWSKVLSVLRTRSAYIVRTKKVVMRLPLRELSDADRLSFEAFVRTVVPGTAAKF